MVCGMTGCSWIVLRIAIYKFCGFQAFKLCKNKILVLDILRPAVLLKLVSGGCRCMLAGRIRNARQRWSPKAAKVYDFKLSLTTE